MSNDEPVVVVGAGPTGLAAAAHLLERGLDPLVLEAGDDAGHNVGRWGHVRLFSEWALNLDLASRRLLEAEGWQEPEARHHPTGSELVERYLRPLARTRELRDRIRYGERVTSVTRLGFDKLRDRGREEAPFEVVAEAPAGERRYLARAVIDASGAYGSPNPLGAAGVPVPGEASLRDRIAYRIPDVLGVDRPRYANRTTLVVGSGHSALNAIRDLVALHADAPETRVAWAVRRPQVTDRLEVGPNEQLAARGRLGTMVRDLVAKERVELVSSFAVQALRAEGARVVAIGADREIGPVDEVVAVTGYRPDLNILRELRLALDPTVESPTALAPLIDPNVHDCGSVPPHGVRELTHPERDFYVAGMKSYGRAPTFLMLTGYEQVRSIAAELAGDHEAAERVELRLPPRGGGACGSAASAGACAVAAAAPAEVGTSTA